MAYTIDELSSALIKADAAGNTADAKVFADEIRRLQSAAADSSAGAGIVKKPAATAAKKTTSAAGLMREMPLQQMGAGMVQGAIIDPIKAVVNFGVSGALNMGLITPQQAQAVAAQEQRLQQQYTQTFKPSGVGEFIGSALLPVGKAGGFAKTAAQGAGLGGMYAAAETAPTAQNYLAEVVKGAGAGAVTGAAAKKAFEVGGRVVRHFQNVLDPKTGALVQAAGDQAPQIVRELAQPQAYPGTTAGEIAARTGNVGVAGLEAQAERESVKTMQAFESARQAREAAQVSGLKGVAKTPAQRKALRDARAAEGEKLYGAVRDNMLGSGNVDKTIKMVDDFVLSEPKNQQLVAELDRIKRNLHDLQTGAPETQPNILMSALDDLKGRLNAVGNEHIVGQLKKIRDQLVKDIPGVEAAETAFRDASKPINRAEVGDTLLKAFTAGKQPKISGQLRPGQYLSKMSDEAKLIMESTGSQFSDNLKNLFGSDTAGLMELQKLRADLQSQLDFAKAKTFGSKGGKKVPVEPAHTIPFLNWVSTTANFLYKRFLGRLDSDTATAIAYKMLDPDAFGKDLQEALLKQAKRDATSTTIYNVGRPTTRATAVLPAKLNSMSSEENQNSLAQ